MNIRQLMSLPSIVAACGLLILGATVVADDRADWPERVIVGTASLGGTYQVYGDGLANLITDEMAVRAVTRATGGPYHNMTLVHTGETELGLVTLGPARELWNGEAEFASGEQMRDVRALFPMYQTPFHVVTRAETGIETLDDLSGRQIGVGPMGGTCATYWEKFFEVLGVEEVSLQYAGATQLADYLSLGLSDAFAFCAGLPIDAFTHLDNRQDVVMFGLTEQQQQILIDTFPLEAFEIPADTYPSMKAPHASVAFWNFAIGHKDLSESFVHALMTLVLEDPEAMEAIHPAASETRADYFNKNKVIWFHPGAVRYYREQGLEVLDEMLPPEMREDVMDESDTGDDATS